MKIVKSDWDGWEFYSGTVGGETIIEADEVQISKVLGPDGSPYAIRRPKVKLGFDLTRSKV
jgi:hypothetical protein